MPSTAPSDRQLMVEKLSKSIKPYLPPHRKDQKERSKEQMEKVRAVLSRKRGSKGRPLLSFTGVVGILAGKHNPLSALEKADHLLLERNPKDYQQSEGYDNVQAKHF